MASPANHDIDFGRRRRHDDGSWVGSGIESQQVPFDVKSWWKVIRLPILLHVDFFLILVTKLWDLIIRLCMCKGQTHHPKVLVSNSGAKTANTSDFYLPVTFQWQSKSYISDKI